MTTEQVESLKSQGNSAFSAGEFEKAIELFTQAINLDSSNHVLFSNRSAAYSSLKKFELALKDAESTTSLKSNWAKGYSRKGAAYFGLDKLEEALAAYRQGLEYEPDNAMLKKGIDDVEAAMASSNAGPFGKIFGPDVFAKMASNPKLSPYLSDQSIFI